MSEEEIRREIEAETQKLMAAGVSEVMARIKAANKFRDKFEQPPDRRAAMIAHCNET
jgi:hypothetical protein